ncbi:MAG: hypothetical protein MPK62_07415, partial [Alphaproteobacteria bacterium]|nr:hypothetical protein [Alphaproteobacteria bacterium]
MSYIEGVALSVRNLKGAAERSGEMTERDAFLQDIENELRQIRDASLWKNERVIASAQGARVRVRGGGNSDSDGDSDGDGDGEREVLNLCCLLYTS